MTTDEPNLNKIEPPVKAIDFLKEQLTKSEGKIVFTAWCIEGLCGLV
jgi:hypothetical protein